MAKTKNRVRQVINYPSFPNERTVESGVQYYHLRLLPQHNGYKDFRQKAQPHCGQMARRIMLTMMLQLAAACQPGLSGGLTAFWHLAWGHKHSSIQNISRRYAFSDNFNEG